MNSDDDSRYHKVIKRVKDLEMTDHLLKHVVDHIIEQFQKGLNGDKTATIRMLPTFVFDLPSGKEKGSILALDLGGTNFRVLLIKLDTSEDIEMIPVTYEIENSLKVGDGKELFKYIATCINKFLQEQGKGQFPEQIPLGFTFSFPCKQTDINKAVLLNWTKGFKCSGVEGKDIVELLQNEIDSIEGPARNRVKIVALVNDTLGTMMACAHRDMNCKIGLIVGTGCNACYMEKMENIKNIQGNFKEKQMVINTEIGAFGDDKELDFIRTKWDLEVDKNSINPGKQTYEKLISGMYIGETVRIILQSLIKDKLLFEGNGPESLKKRDSFKAKFVSEIDTEHIDKYYFVKKVFRKHFDFKVTNTTDLEIVLRVNSAVSRRAAQLAASGCAAIFKRIEQDSSIAFDGTLIRKHPFFRLWMEEQLKRLTEYKFSLIESRDGSGRGAAIVAAVSGRDLL